MLGVVLLTSATVALMLALTWAGFATLGRRRRPLGPVESALKHIAQAIGKGNGAIPVNASVISPVKSHSERRLVLSKDPRALPRRWTFALGVPSVTWAVLLWAALLFQGLGYPLRSGIALLMTLNHSPLNVNQPSVFLSPTAK